MGLPGSVLWQTTYSSSKSTPRCAIVVFGSNGSPNGTLSALFSAQLWRPPVGGREGMLNARTPPSASSGRSVMALNEKAFGNDGPSTPSGTMEECPVLSWLTKINAGLLGVPVEHWVIWAG